MGTLVKKKHIALDAVKHMLALIGENPEREGLKETPARVVKSWEKLYGGYDQDPAELFAVDFASEGYDQLIVLEPIEFWSTCEHHMLPFYGTVSIGYIPGKEGRVVGLSKLARVVEIYARRLQIQERLTQQIAKAIQDGVKPAGVAVIVKSQHLCMVARGVEKQMSSKITSAMIGALRDNASARAEFLNLIGVGR